MTVFESRNASLLSWKRIDFQYKNIFWFCVYISKTWRLKTVFYKCQAEVSKQKYRFLFYGNASVRGVLLKE